MRERNWTIRAFQPYDTEVPGVRYGYNSGQLPDYRGRRNGRLEEQAARLRLAREAGYLVVRASDLRTLRRDRPFELNRYPEDREDLDD